MDSHSSKRIDNMIKCQICNNPDCIRTAEEVLDTIYDLYTACENCVPEPEWNTTAPFKTITDIQTLSSTFLLCNSCGRRPLNAVMAHALSIMIRHGERDENAGLIRTGTPLIYRGFPIMYPPRLGPDSLVLIVDNTGLLTAQDIVGQVPEIKGVILRTGSQAKSVGILDSNSRPHEYTLLAGCDMRCDVVQSAFGELVIYKNQSKIHIEFDNDHKMQILGSLDVKGILAGKVVVDGMCGPGTLGLMSMLFGARKVIFNDAWRPAIENLLLNLEVNSAILGVEVEPVLSITDLSLIGDKPVQVAVVKRDGRIAAKVYFGDLRYLPDIIDGCDVCLIDAFPAVDPSKFVNIWGKKDKGSRIIVV
ncbi:MAG: hypothetical protein C5S46_02190 [Candidatus Methanomarinus sp.]|uniref:Uncharacterized protein n=1 Tax=Candidatus Methanomarinus sp. TaxID=3386244 RepID=A0AC61SBS2_9EURY|nr:MAG: hypothetical protein C5S46_02190 [ANME-2 cluster archaeon]